MAQLVKRLSDRSVQNASPQGKIPRYLPDGAGLYLQVSPTGTKSWVFRYSVKGRERYMGLGPFPDVSLADARGAANDCRKLRRQDIDPIDHRAGQRAEALLASAATKTFRECASVYVESKKDGWRNAKHAAQWTATLETYAYPVIGDLPVQTVDTALVEKVLKPIWASKTETASRVRGRIEAVLDWATVQGFRKGENPARWRGHLDKLLPARSKVRKVEHHPALPYGELPGFLEALRGQEGIAARALEFTILTVARTNETIGATLDEIGARAKLWTIAAERMKAERDHRVPLSKRALAILEEMKDEAAGDFVFPGGKASHPLSNMAMLQLVERMNARRTAAGQPRWTDPKNGNKDIVPHGFRSTFRDWASERTNFPSEVVEMALAHAVGDKVEAAYRRGDLFEKRRKLMNAWAAYCTTPVEGAKVIPIGRKGA
jgi:integrase